MHTDLGSKAENWNVNASKGCPKRKRTPYSGHVLISVRKKMIRFDADLYLFFINALASAKKNAIIIHD